MKSSGRRLKFIACSDVACWNLLTKNVYGELELRNLKVERQKPIPVVYKDVKLECGYRIDLLVESRIVVELKSIEAFAPIHEAIILTYIRLSGCRLGLLINFNVTVLKHGVKRYII